MRKLKTILSFSFFILLVSILTLIYVYSKDSESNFECGTTEITLICGTKNLTENQSEGKNLFNENCAACHHVSKDSFGPNLMKTDSLIFIDWLSKSSNRKNKSNLNNDYGIEYHQMMWNERLNINEISKIHEYCSYFANE